MNGSEKWQVGTDEIKMPTPLTTGAILKGFAKALWKYIREAAGEEEYRRYRDRALARGESPLPAADFYLSRLEQKYSRPNRCC